MRSDPPQPPVPQSVVAILAACLASTPTSARSTVVAAVGGASALCTALKLHGARRPPIGIQETLETDYSFPSGHVTGTVALCGMLVVVVERAGATPSKGGLPALRSSSSLRSR